MKHNDLSSAFIRFEATPWAEQDDKRAAHQRPLSAFFMGDGPIAVEWRGMIVFVRIDHAKAAEETGLKLRPAEVFVFGYPEAERL